jgi:hypothetical protein
MVSRVSLLSCSDRRARSTTVERGIIPIQHTEEEVMAVREYSEKVVLGIEQCRRHIGNMARLGRQCEGATLVLQRLEHRLLDTQLLGQSHRRPVQHYFPMSDRK